MWLIFLGAISPRTGSFMMAAGLPPPAFVRGGWRAVDESIEARSVACGNGHALGCGGTWMDSWAIDPFWEPALIESRSGPGSEGNVKAVGASCDRGFGPRMRCTARLATHRSPSDVLERARVYVGGIALATRSLVAAKARTPLFARLAEGNERRRRPTDTLSWCGGRGSDGRDQVDSIRLAGQTRCIRSNKIS